jgi:YfiH family protein
MAWEWRQGKQMSYLTIPEWEAEGVQIGFSARWGGVSTSPYSSLNLGLHVEDDPQAVRTNRKTWFSQWNTDASMVVIGEQVHGSSIHEVEIGDAGRGSDSLDTAIPGVDGLFTRGSLALMAFFADCVPVFFYHPGIKMVGIAHAGWKGTVSKIALVMLERFREQGADPAECWAAIGPSIGPCCYEVDTPVIAAFREEFRDTPFLSAAKTGHAMLNLWEANRFMLLKAGVPEQQIWTAEICTACHTDSFFSHRIEGPKTGRMAGWIRQTPKRED